jgi:hypothetical protein
MGWLLLLPNGLAYYFYWGLCMQVIPPANIARLYVPVRGFAVFEGSGGPTGFGTASDCMGAVQRAVCGVLQLRCRTQLCTECNGAWQSHCNKLMIP